MNTTSTYLDSKAKRNLLNRLARIEGQVRALKSMVAEERCADEILVQATAARGALGQFTARLLERHLTDCAQSCMTGSTDEVMARISKAVSVALRLSS